VPPDGFFHAVFEQGYVIQAQAIDAFPLRVFARDGDMLRHIAKDDDHKSKAHGQAHRLDDAIEFVSGEEFDVTAHYRLIVDCLTV